MLLGGGPTCWESMRRYSGFGAARLDGWSDGPPFGGNDQGVLSAMDVAAVLRVEGQQLLLRNMLLRKKSLLCKCLSLLKSAPLRKRSP